MTTSMSKPTTMPIRETAWGRASLDGETRPEVLSHIKGGAPSQMSKPITTSIMKQQSTITTKQLLAKEVFSPQITKFRRERIIPLYKDETWSADLIDKSSLSKYNNNYKFILTVIDMFTKYAWVIPLKNKSGLSINNGFKIVLGEHLQGGSESRKPEKLWVVEVVSFTKHLNLYLKNMKQNYFLLIVI